MHNWEVIWLIENKKQKRIYMVETFDYISSLKKIIRCIDGLYVFNMIKFIS